ncbi:MAG: tape measure protein [Gemmatimonadaceae bacterium]|nr:tape measure protein [Gemmatimonadaceae bacterium]
MTTANLGFNIDSSPFEALQRAANLAHGALQQMAQSARTSEQAANRAAGAPAGQKSPVAQRMEEIASASQAASRAVTSGVGNMTQVLGGFAAAGTGGGIAGGISMVVSGLQGILGAAGPVGLAVAGVIGVVGVLSVKSVELVTSLGRVEDQFRSYEQRLKLSLDTTYAARDSMAELIRIANATGTGIDTTIQAFTRFARNIKDLGASRQELLLLSETVQKLGVISGASQGEIAGGVIQFAQALAAGRLNGDELRSIMENFPPLIKIIADGLGRSVGEIRAMGAAGELTSDKILPAILGQAEKVNAEFESMPDTIDRASQRMANQFQTIKKNFAESLDASEIVRGAMSQIEGLLNWIATKTKVDPVAADRADRNEIRALEANIRSMSSTANMTISPGKSPLERSMAAQREKERDDARAQINSWQAEIDRRKAAIEQRANAGINAALGAMADADAAEENRRNKVTADGIREAREANETLSKRTQLTERLQRIEAARAAALARLGELNADAISRSINADEIATITKNIEMFSTSAGILRMEIDGLGGPGAQLARRLADMDAAARQAGGGFSLLQKAMELAQASAKAGTGIGTEAALGLLMREQAIQTRVRAADMGVDAENQRRLTVATLQGADAVREQTIQQRVAEYQFKTFGTLIEQRRAGWRQAADAVRLYEQAIRAADKAARTLDEAQSSMTSRDTIAMTEAQTARVSEGAAAMRSAAANERARQAIRRTGEVAAGGRVLSEFNASEELQAGQAIDKLMRDRVDMEERLANLASPRALRELAIQKEIADQVRQIGEASRARIEAEIRARAAADDSTFARQQVIDLRKEADALTDEYRLLGLIGEEYAVQVALLAKKKEIQQSGRRYTDEELDAVLKETEELARRRYREKPDIDAAERMRKTFDDLGGNIAEGLGSAFKRAFSTGEIAWRDFVAIGRTAIDQVNSAIIDSFLVRPMKKSLDGLSDSFFGGKLLNMLGGAGAAGGGAILPGGVGAMPYHGGGDAGFGMGSMRTLPVEAFASAKRYHGGRQALGLAADEEPAILKRGERVTSHSDANKGAGATVVLQVKNEVVIQGNADERVLAKALAASEARTAARYNDAMRRGKATI